MDKDISISSYNQAISLNDRKNLNLTGIKKIESFDDTEFIMDTVLGFLVVSGLDLELIKMDSMQGNVTIKGSINSLVYMDDNKTQKKENSIFNRLFK